ncbi:hypothetical protein C9374_004307 [Naegleria lovaniensis]|uniref:CBS domain-containing protein n=1 Tax=Naegleria lovaniensis TaxID=51637 RepID=A0AA88GQT1_NAELO|nr:uncharacterized protein C9374_004307 [Naegleria lovaniensis]KAG2383636.1 hypothetical protein C9374_004307 [Naegleria lovaniensis]
MKVKLFMIPKDKVASVPLTATLADASKLIVERKIGSVVVVNDSGEPVGIITKSDLVRAGFVDTKPSTTPVSEIMHKNLEFCSEDLERDEVAELLMKKKIHHILVRGAHHQWVGLTTSLDIVTEAALDAKAFPWTRTHK